MTASVLIITPTYDERDNLTTLVAGVHSVLAEAHVLVVDDASPDGTGELADRLADADDRIFVLHRAGKLGLGSAYVDGFRWGLERDYRIFGQMDTDLSHDPAMLPTLLAALESALERRADVVIGSRNVPGGGVRGWGPGRRLLSKGGSLYARMFLGVGIRDLTSGYKLLRREVLEALDLDSLDSEGYAFLAEMTYRALASGFRVVEIPIVFVDRRAGQSKMSFPIFLEAVWRMPVLRLKRFFGRL